MDWFFIALLAPALWSVSNHIDKYLIEKYFKDNGIGALMIFSSIIGLFMLPLIVLIQPNVLNITPLQAGTVTINGIIAVTAVLIYLYALEKDETSIVVTLFQTIPVFAFFLGYLVLGEVLTLHQLIGSLLIILAAISLSLDITSKIPKLKSQIFFLMILASFLFALSSVTFKVVALETDFWTTTFWGYVGATIMGIFFLACVKSYRTEFMRVIQKNKLSLLGINALNEIIAVTADLAFRFATLLVPLALVTTVNGFQPLFVFLYGVIMTLFFPKMGKESLLKKHLVQKIITIVIMFIGTYILNT